jgi:LPXTG-motif cell wall-anchored protein
VTALAALPLALSALGATGAVGAPLTFDPSGTGSLTVVRQDHLANPTTDLVDVTACLVRYNAAGLPLDLTTNIGWVRAAQITISEGAELADEADCITQRTVGGETVFSNLEIGLWHVSMVYVEGEYAGEVASEPFMTPIPRVADDGETWDFDVRAYPKAFEPVLPPNRASIGGTVWRNYANDGAINPGESFVQGVRVTVYRVIDCPPVAAANASLNDAVLIPFGDYCKYMVGEAFTGADGQWRVDNLPYGRKVVRFHPQYAGPHYTFANIGVDFDGVDALGRSGIVEVVYDEMTVVNAGLLFTGPVVSPSPTPSPSPSPAPTPPGLPVTGAQIAGLVVAAAGLIGAGFLFLLGRKRKDTADA